MKTETRLTEAERGTLHEIARWTARGKQYWWRRASCAKLAEKGLAEPYAPPGVREEAKRKPYRLTPAGRALLSEGEG